MKPRFEIYLEMVCSALLALIGVVILVFATDLREYTVLLMAIGFTLPFAAWISIEHWLVMNRRHKTNPTP